MVMIRQFMYLELENVLIVPSIMSSLAMPFQVPVSFLCQYKCCYLAIVLAK